MMMCFSFTDKKEELQEKLLQGKFVQYSNDIKNKKYADTTSHMHQYGQDIYGRGLIHTVYPDEKIRQTSTVPVCVEVRPFTKAEILEFYGWPDDDTLPFAIRYRDEILDY